MRTPLHKRKHPSQTMGPYGQSVFCTDGEVEHWFKPVPWGTMTPIKAFLTKQLRLVLNWSSMCDATNGVDEFWLLSVQLEQQEMPRRVKNGSQPHWSVQQSETDSLYRLSRGYHILRRVPFTILDTRRDDKENDWACATEQMKGKGHVYLNTADVKAFTILTA